MTVPGDRKSADGAALWRRFRALDRTGTNRDEPTALELAAYAEGRLNEAAARRIEAWLCAHPEALDDVVAARTGEEASASRAVTERAAALVAADPAGAEIIPFRRKATPSYAWRMHVTRAAVAASLLLTGLVGFTLGSQSYANLFGSTTSITTGGLFDQSNGVFTSEDFAI
jgi:anti-sigma factor RsiW